VAGLRRVQQPHCRETSAAVHLRCNGKKPTGAAGGTADEKDNDMDCIVQ